MTAKNRDQLHTWAIRTIETFLYANIGSHVLGRTVTGITVQEKKTESGLIEFMGVIRVELQHRITSPNLLEILNALNEFTESDPCNAPYCETVIDGIRYVIGDGDDSEAVHLENNAICVWLRGWTEEDSPSPIIPGNALPRPGAIG